MIMKHILRNYKIKDKLKIMKNFLNKILNLKALNFQFNY